MKPINIVVTVFAAVLALIGFFGRKSAVKASKVAEVIPKKLYIKKELMSLLSIFGSWLFLIELLTFWLKKVGSTTVEISAWHVPKTVFGIDTSPAIITLWVSTAVIIVLSLLFRFFVVPKMNAVPKGSQNVIETGIDLKDTVKHKLHHEKSSEQADKKVKKRKRLIKSAIIIAVWAIVVELITLIFGKSKRAGFEVSIWAERVNFFGLNLSKTILCTWAIILILAVLSLVFRIFFVSKMKEEPGGFQNFIELAVESIENYTSSKTTGNLGDNLGAYIFTVAVFMISCAFMELLGIRAPTSDITLTFALSIITFCLINYYGIKRKGVFGRIKSLAKPTPIVFPIKLVTEIAIPVSLACRLFGNMLGGMIVMDLLYMALGNAAVGIPSIFGLYFNVFHPLIQTFIFVTLSLTFINEAVE